jgi:hypothetical protein
VRFRVCSTSSSIGNSWMDNLRPGGALRWKVETIGWEGQRVVCGKPVPSMLYLLPMSIKDR